MRLFWEGPRTPNCWRRAEGFQGQQQKWDHFVCKCNWNLISSKGKKKRKKNYLHCVLYKIYIYDPLSYLIFFICVLDPIWYPLITKSFEWMTSFRNYTNMNDKRTFLILRPLHALIQTSWGFRFQGSFIDTVNALNETVLPWAELVPFVLATPSVKFKLF